MVQRARSAHCSRQVVGPEGDSGGEGEDCFRLEPPSFTEKYLVTASDIVEEAVPTKISLMICSDHKEGGDGSGKQQFLPLYRSVRAPFFRNHQHTRRK
ncbi:hypothetical protein ACOMHN_026468 [Nucella lapillus]